MFMLNKVHADSSKYTAILTVQGKIFLVGVSSVTILFGQTKIYSRVIRSSTTFEGNIYLVFSDSVEVYNTSLEVQNRYPLGLLGDFISVTSSFICVASVTGDIEFADSALNFKINVNELANCTTCHNSNKITRPYACKTTRGIERHCSSLTNSSTGRNPQSKFLTSKISKSFFPPNLQKLGSFFHGILPFVLIIDMSCIGNTCYILMEQKIVVLYYLSGYVFQKQSFFLEDGYKLIAASTMLILCSSGIFSLCDAGLLAINQVSSKFVSSVVVDGQVVLQNDEGKVYKLVGKEIIYVTTAMAKAILGFVSPNLVLVLSNYELQDGASKECDDGLKSSENHRENVLQWYKQDASGSMKLLDSVRFGTRKGNSFFVCDGRRLSKVVRKKDVELLLEAEDKCFANADYFILERNKGFEIYKIKDRLGCLFFDVNTQLCNNKRLEYYYECVATLPQYSGVVDILVVGETIYLVEDKMLVSYKVCKAGEVSRFRLNFAPSLICNNKEHLVMAYNNFIFIISDGAIETLKLNFTVKHIHCSDSLIFAAFMYTLKIYHIRSKRLLFMQVFNELISGVYYSDYLFIVLETKYFRFSIKDDSLNIPQKYDVQEGFRMTKHGFVFYDRKVLELVSNSVYKISCTDLRRIGNFVLAIDNPGFRMYRLGSYMANAYVDKSDSTLLYDSLYITHYKCMDAETLEGVKGCNRNAVDKKYLSAETRVEYGESLCFKSSKKKTLGDNGIITVSNCTIGSTEVGSNRENIEASHAREKHCNRGKELCSVAYRVKDFEHNTLYSGAGMVIDVFMNDELFMTLTHADYYLFSLYKRCVLFYSMRLKYKPTKMACYDNKVVIGSKCLIRFYEIGKIQLLYKFRLVLPSQVTCMRMIQEQLLIGTRHHSVFQISKFDCMDKSVTTEPKVEDPTHISRNEKFYKKYLDYRTIMNTKPNNGDKLFKEYHNSSALHKFGYKMKRECVNRQVTCINTINNNIIIGEETGSLSIIDRNFSFLCSINLGDVPTSIVVDKNIFVICKNSKICELAESNEDTCKVILKIMKNGGENIANIQRFDLSEKEFVSVCMNNNLKFDELIDFLDKARE